MLQLTETKIVDHNTPFFSLPLTCIAGSQGVLVRFNIAYKTNFGQQLRLVGNTDSLGQWDIERSVPMQWTQGDIWTADVSLPAK